MRICGLDLYVLVLVGLLGSRVILRYASARRARTQRRGRSNAIAKYGRYVYYSAYIRVGLKAGTGNEEMRNEEMEK